MRPRCLAAGEVRHQVVRHEADSGLEQRQVELPAAALVQRGHDRERRPDAGALVDQRDADPDRLAVGLSGHAHDPGLALEERVVAGRPASGRPAVAADRAVDELRVAFAQGRVAEPSPVGGSGPQALHDDVRARREPSSAASPSGCVRSSASERLPAFAERKSTPSSPQVGGLQLRVSSPPSGRSTLTTSAPSALRISVQYGPASELLRSSTRIPESGWKAIGVHHLYRGRMGGPVTGVSELGSSGRPRRPSGSTEVLGLPVVERWPQRRDLGWPASARGSLAPPVFRRRPRRGSRALRAPHCTGDYEAAVARLRAHGLEVEEHAFGAYDESRAATWTTPTATSWSPGRGRREAPRTRSRLDDGANDQEEHDRHSDDGEKHEQLDERELRQPGRRVRSATEAREDVLVHLRSISRARLRLTTRASPSSADGSRHPRRRGRAGRSVRAGRPSTARLPRSRISTPSGTSFPTRARVVSESSNCPPWPAEQIRAARTTSMPRYPLVADRGSPVCKPMRTRTSASSASRARRAPAAPATAPRTASLARVNEKKNASPCVSTSWPPDPSSSRRMRPVIGVDGQVALAELLEQACRPLDVREEHRDGAARKVLTVVARVTEAP